MSHEHVPVLIVGGGTAGLTSSILLSRLGVPNLLVERHATTSNLPKAHILNQRTMEVFREAGIADDVYARSAPLELMSRTVWYTSLAGPTPLHGREIGRIDAWGGGSLATAYGRASPCRSTNLPQHHLEPLLLTHAQRYPGSRQLFGHEVVGVTLQEHGGVTATVRVLNTGEELTVSADHVIAADGGRTVGRELGLAFTGRRGLVDMVSTHFSADLGDRLPDPAGAIYRFVNPDGPGLVHRGTLVQMGGGGWGRGCREWVFSFSLRPDDPPEFSEQDISDTLRTMLGLPGLPIQVHRISPWNVEGITANRYRIGDVFFVGDAAHRHPPAGGLGLNTAVQDAHNLAWKIAAVTSGTAGVALLDSYEAERRPIGQRNAEHALRSFFQNQDVDRALGFDAATTPQAGWALLADYFAEPPAGPLHARVGAAIRSKRYAYQAHALEVGFGYGTGALIAEPTGPPQPPGDAVCDYLPTTYPGHRVPHIGLLAGSSAPGPTSTVDLPGGQRFVVVTGATGDTAWRAAAERCRVALPAVPLQVAVVGRGDTGDDDHWARVREVADDGAILVRPDAHVAWRSEGAPEHPDVLTEVLGKILA